MMMMLLVRTATTTTMMVMRVMTMMMTTTMANVKKMMQLTQLSWRSLKKKRFAQVANESACTAQRKQQH